MEDCVFKGDVYIALMKCKDFDTDKLYHGNHYLKVACDVVRSIPSADVVERPLYERALSDVVRLSVERKKGKWIKPTRVPDSMLEECSVCGFDCGAYTFNYCPNCGAEMGSE